MPEQVTLVTGARKGLGRFIAEQRLAKGDRVYGCSRQPSDLESPRYEHFCLDVADERAVRQMFSRIRKEAKRLDHLVNNAGVAAMNHALLTPMSAVDAILSTNVAGTFLMCREAARVMQANAFGRIVNVISVAAPLHLEGEAIYAASKSAVQTLTQILARELARFGITVNAVGPTPVMTDLIRNVPREKIEGLLARQAIARLGAPEDVLNVVEFFLRRESEFVTAQSVFLGGVC